MTVMFWIFNKQFCKTITDHILAVCHTHIRWHKYLFTFETGHKLGIAILIINHQDKTWNLKFLRKVCKFSCFTFVSNRLYSDKHLLGHSKTMTILNHADPKSMLNHQDALLQISYPAIDFFRINLNVNYINSAWKFLLCCT